MGMDFDMVPIGGVVVGGPASTGLDWFGWSFRHDRAIIVVTMGVLITEDFTKMGCPIPLMHWAVPMTEITFFEF